MHAYDACVRCMHTMHAYEACTRNMHTLHAYYACILCMHTMHACTRACCGCTDGCVIARTWGSRRLRVPCSLIACPLCRMKMPSQTMKSKENQFTLEPPAPSAALSRPETLKSAYNPLTHHQNDWTCNIPLNSIHFQAFSTISALRVL